MKYFLHDTNAFQDEKITLLFMTYGYEGIGLFYCILEKIALQEQPIKTDVLKKQLFIGKKLEKCWKFLEEIDLISSNNGETFNKQLLNFSEKFKIKKEKNRERISEWRKNQQDKENVTHYESVRNNSKVNRSKVNKNTLLSEINISDVEDNPLYEFSEIAKAFQHLFIKNLQEKEVSTEKLQKAKAKAWIDPIRHLIEIDKYTINDIREVYKLLETDDFWKRNVLSTSKLREKFQTLLLKARSTDGKNKSDSKGCSVEQLAETIGKAFAVDNTQ